jgi:hypothetical protein
MLYVPRWRNVLEVIDIVAAASKTHICQPDRTSDVQSH